MDNEYILRQALLVKINNNKGKFKLIYISKNFIKIKKNIYLNK